MSPRTTKQYEEIRVERRNLIMDSALKHFAKEGYHATTITHIAKHAGISKGLMYNYFESKEELLKTILDKGIDELVEIFDPNKDGVLEVPEMEFFLTETFRIIKEQRDFWKLYMSITLQTSVFKLIEKRIEELYIPLTKMTIEYFTAAGFKNPTMEAILFGCLLDGVTLDYVMKPDMFPIEDVKNELIERYCRMQPK